MKSTLEDNMNHFQDADDFQAALAEAANAFMKTMSLRGYAVRDYPQNFVAHMGKHAKLQFEVSPKGASPLADSAIGQFLQAHHHQQGLRPVSAVSKKSAGFPVVGQRQAA